MILIHNDGKEKYQSFEASVDVSGAYVYAYGETQEEAIDNLKIEVSQLTRRLQSVDYSDTQQVDCMGRKLERSGAV